MTTITFRQSPIPQLTSGSSTIHRYTCKSYTNKLLVNLHSLWLSESLCDIELTAGNLSVKAHRAVLCAASAYFQAMFTNGLSEQNQSVVQLKLLTPETLSQIIKFIYTGDIEVTVENVQDLIVAADLLELTEVVLVCSNFLKRELQPSNAIGFYRFALAHHFPDLVEIVRNYICFNFVPVSAEEEFNDCPITILMEFIQSEYLRIDSEFEVFSASMNWILHSISTRRRHVFEILTHIRIPLVSTKLLDNFITDCKDISLKVALKSVQKDLQNKVGSLVSLTVEPRLCGRKKIFVIGGSKRELISSWTKYECTYESVECYDTFEKKWFRVAPMNIGRILPGIALFGGKIYVIGGEQDSIILANGEYYDPEEDTWTRIAAMLMPKCEFGLCAFNNNLYAFGGWIGDDIGDSIEKYDPVADKWTLEGSMPEPRFSMGVVEHNDLIYIVGGCIHTQRHLQDLLCYNPVTSTWTHLALMLTSRSQMGVCVLGGFLYVVGGTNRKCQVLTSVERYSFEENKWYACASMSTGRASPAVAATSGQLYVIGGYQTSDLNDFYKAQVTISDAEQYDPSTDKWEPIPALPESRSEAGAVVI